MYIFENTDMNKMWDEETNLKRGLSKESITCGSGKDAMWRCPKCGKNFSKTPNRVSTNIKKGENPCPFCSGKKAAYEDSLMSKKREEIMEHWDFDKNFKKGLRPCEILPNSNKKANFICKKHDKKYQQIISDFYAGHNGCGACTGKEATKERNLQILYPEIALEVNRQVFKDKYNKEFNAETILPFCNDKLPFDCKICGEVHWKKLSERVNQATGCPKFNAINQKSRPEVILYLYLKEFMGDLESKFQINSNRSELDLYSPQYKLAIEYDGGIHNTEQSKKRDEVKNRYCIENNIHLIRIREQKTCKIDTKGIHIINCIYKSDLSYMKDVINEVKEIIINKFGVKDREIDVQAIIDYVKENMMDDMVFNHSLAKQYPAIAEGLIEKDKERAKMLKKGSTRIKLTYICECGHTVEKTPKNLVKTKCKCPKCNKYIIDITASNRVLTFK